MKNQKSKIKMQNDNSKLKIILKFANFAFLIVIFQLTLSQIAQAQSVSYPVVELGNCGNQKECYLFCEIAQNTPACWSWGKYVINSQVLGQQDEESPEEKVRRLGINFPIAQLGNCSSPKECMQFCEQPENKQACFIFAKEKGLHQEDPKDPPSHVIETAMEELGCSSKEGCMSLCSLPENHQKCRDFARNHGIQRRYEGKYGRPLEEIVSLAENGLGCLDAASCWKLCNQPENKDRCREFTQKHNLIKVKQSLLTPERKQQLVETAKNELGCDSQESCKEFCSQPQNHTTCSRFGQKHNLGKPEFKDDKPCTSEKECRVYCEKHPYECPGYDGEKYEESRSEDSANQKSAGDNKTSFGSFLGPSGCKTESECKAYCEKHPQQCPGFPKDAVEASSAFQKLPYSQSPTDQDFQKYQTGASDSSPEYELEFKDNFMSKPN